MNNYKKKKKSFFAPNNPSPLSSPLDQRLKFSVSEDNEEQDTKQINNQNNNEEDLDHNDINSIEYEFITKDDNLVPSEFFNRLKNFSLFKNAPNSFHTKIASNLKLMQFHPQEYIIKKGEQAKAMYWILKGTVNVTSTDGESIYAELASGSYFGEIGILFNRPRIATVIAKTKVLVGVLTGDALNSVLSFYPAMERRIRDEAQERLALLEKKNKHRFPLVINNLTARNYDVIEKGRYANQIAAASELLLGPILPPLRQTSTLENRANIDSTVSVQEFIKRIPIFSKLPSRVIHKMALGAEPLMLDYFQYIFRKGDIGSDIYFVVNGEAEVLDYEDVEMQRERLLARLHIGSYFGEMAFLSYLSKKDIKRSASIRSVTAIELIVIKSNVLESLCNEFPFIIEHMKKLANERSKLNSSKEYFNTLPLSKKYLLDNQLFSARRVPFSWNLPSLASNFGSNVSASTVPKDLDPYGSIGAQSESFQNNEEYFGTFNKDHMGLHKKLIKDQVANFPKWTPSVPSLHNFQGLQELSPIDFEYIPRSKRIKLATVLSRRSSILSTSSLIPDVILLKVFEYLTLPELMRLKRVSKTWRKLLSTAPNLFVKLDLTPWNTSIDDAALKAITNFVGWRPTYIDISNCFHITDESFSYMINEIGIAGKIKVLKMKSTWEISAMAIMDLTVHSVGQYLEEIDLSNCRKVKDIVVERLIGNSSDGNQRNTENYGCMNLKVLNVGYCKHLTDNFMYHLSKFANFRLESLDLTRCTTITDLGFEYWAHRPFTNLKKLSLKDCTFLTDRAIAAIASSASNLEILDLNFCCAISDNSIKVLSLECPRLRELDLSFCGSAVSDTSLVSISLYLRNLQSLILKGCVRVTRAGLDTLLTGCCPLSFIDVSQCKNVHFYPGGIPAQPLCVSPNKKSAFVTGGVYQRIVEIAL